ncbi:MAG: glycosyl hydrolase 53 family protein [Clostridia bacterium]|nr:glycosyl hydrolase 53 family protein [Clostridia bacterium]
MTRNILCLLFVLMLLPPLMPAARAEAGETLFVKKVENLPDDFIFGMDVSSVLSEEESGVKYYDFDGRETDLFELLSQNGINYIRVRVWNDPYDAKGRGYGGGNCDIDRVVLIGRRATASGMKLLVDFHYSDFWADPSKQMEPKAWKGMGIEEKTEAVYRYTRQCLEKLRAAGVDVGMVQVGNETNQWLCGEKTWFNIQYLMQAGARATREIYPEALVALHFTDPQNGVLSTYARKLDYYKVDYDVFGTSYYPFWHGSLENLSAVLSEIADTYGKKVMVMETSYPYTGGDTDFSGNTMNEGDEAYNSYPFSAQGQVNFLCDLTDTLVNRTRSAVGLCYWEGAWITVGGSSREENSVLWEKYGSGWATSYAASYDPNDAGKYYGGSAVDNQAFFDEKGRALSSLQVFSLMREGRQAALYPVSAENVTLICDLNAPIVLPEEVNIVMNDNSRRAVPVQWDFTAEMDRAMHSGGAKKYEIRGEAEGMQVFCQVSMLAYNYLQDYSFEDGGVGWVFHNAGATKELYVEDKKSDSLTGTKHAHFWSAAKNSVEFTLEQEVEGLPEGRYQFSVSIMGGDGGETTIYAYVILNGDLIGTAPMRITSYNNWETGVVPAFDCPAGSKVVVGVYVKCEGTGNGAWGKIDDAMLLSVK